MRGYSDIWAMIGQLPLGGMTVEELKCVLVSSVSKGRTESLRELTGGELERLRQELRGKTGSKPRKSDGEKRRKRSQVLKLIEAYGVDTKDWTAVNAFVEEERIAGKAFSQLTLEELGQLRRKMWSINRKRRQKETKAMEAEVERAMAPIKRGATYRTSAPLRQFMKSGKYN